MESQTLNNTTASGLSDEDKNWAMFAHLCTFASMIIPLANIIGPIVIKLTRGKESSFVNRHANTVLNFQITMMIAVFAIFPVMFVPLIFAKQIQELAFIPMALGLLVIVAWAIAGIVFSIIGAIRAREGREYTYPLTLKILK